jgi:hypothetical protein
VLSQQKDVMDAVQRLRAKAYAQKKLASTKQQKVAVITEQNKQVIVIQSAVPGTVYVPYYNPVVVYGAWPYPAYPPVYYPPPPGYVAGTALASGLAFATGVAVGSAIWGGFNWGHNDININVNKTNTINKWEHNSVHRRGVQYNNAELRQQYGKADFSHSNQRLDFRGRGGEQVARPGTDRAGSLDRSGGPGGRTGLDRPSGPSTGQVRGPEISGVGTRSSAFSNIGNGSAARLNADRGRASLGGAGLGGGASRGAGGPARGGGFRGRR